MQNRYMAHAAAALCVLAAAWAPAQPPAGPELKYEVLAAQSAVHPGDTARIALRFTLDEGWHVNSHEPYDDFSTPTVLELTDPGPVRLDAIAYPEHEDFEAAFQPDPLAVYGPEFVIGVALAVPEDTEPGRHTLAGKLNYQACDDKVCAFPTSIELEIPLEVAAADTPVEPLNAAVFAAIEWPEDVPGDPAEEPADTPETDPDAAADASWEELADRFTVAGRSFGYQGTDEFLRFIERAERAGDTPVEHGDAADTITAADTDTWSLEGRSWWLVVALVLAGGLLLNLTPCVLPLIPINIAIIGAGAQAGSRARGFALGGTYGAGIALVYGLLGLVVVLGMSAAFGTLNANPYFNLSITVLFVVLGLAMFDIIRIDFSKYQAKIGVRKNERGSFYIALFMGSVSALLAGACVAPVVIYTIVYAQDLYNAGWTIALLLPFLLGVGMALPWPFAGAGLSFLPKPGVWMVRVKQGFGIFILLFAAYYGYKAYEGFTGRLAGPGAVEQSVAEADEHGWLHSLDAGLAQADAEGKPVLIDFWATWCTNCLVMNNTTLKEPAVLDALEDYVKVKYQAENPNEEATARVLQHYDVLGLPTYVILKPKDG